MAFDGFRAANEGSCWSPWERLVVITLQGSCFKVNAMRMRAQALEMEAESSVRSGVLAQDISADGMCEIIKIFWDWDAL